MPTSIPSPQKTLMAYQHFLSLLAADDLSGARGALFEAIKEARVIDRPRLLATLLLKLGHFYLDREADLQNAVHAFAAGINLLQNADFGEDLKKALLPISRMEKGYLGSRDSLPDGYQPETEEDLLQAEQDPQLAVKLLLGTGNCLLELGQDEAALKSFETTMDLPSVQEDEVLRAKIFTNIAEIHRRYGRFTQAESFLDQAQAIFRNHPGEIDIKEFLAIFASLRSDQQQWEKAIRLFEAAVDLYGQNKDDKGYSRTLIRLAKLYLERRDFIKAKGHLESALELGKEAGDKSNLAFVYRGLARCFMEEGDFRSAIPHLEQCFRTLDRFVETAIQTEQGKLSRIAGMEWALNALIDCYLEWRQHDDHPNEIERLILGKIDQLHGLILDDLVGGTAKPYQKSEPIDLSDALGLGDQNPIRQTVMADYIFAEERMIDHPRREQVPFLARLVYHLTEQQLIIAYERSEAPPLIISKPESRSDLRALVRQLIRSLKVHNQLRGTASRGQGLDDTEDHGDPQALSKEFYDLLIRPIEAFLPEPGGILVVEPHDAFHLIPFSMLSPEPGKYLCDQYAILVSPSQDTMNTIRSYQPYQNDLSAARALIVGNPSIKADLVVHGKALGQLADLPGAEEEASLIKRLFDKEKVTYLTQGDANEAAIKDAMKNSNVIHLATHGLAFEDNPMASSFVVAGDKGYVTARTIRDWKMPADLVVLSACQTALGKLADTEGVIGLTRSFFIAGARTLVVSLWSVNDSATSLLMRYFYEALFAGNAVPFALRNAQLKLKHQPEFADPFYWAGFIGLGADE